MDRAAGVGDRERRVQLCFRIHLLTEQDECLSEAGANLDLVGAKPEG